MKIGKTGLFLVILIPIWIIVDWIVGTYICIPYGCPCPGGGCDVPMGAWIFFGILNAIFLITGILGYWYLNKKK